MSLREWYLVVVVVAGPHGVPGFVPGAAPESPLDESETANDRICETFGAQRAAEIPSPITFTERFVVGGLDPFGRD